MIESTSRFRPHRREKKIVQYRTAPIARLITAAALVAACGGGGDGGTVSPPPPANVASVSLSRDTATLVPSASVTLVATPRDAAGTALSRTVTWTSSDPGKAAVSGAGVVTGVAIGSATITAMSEGRSATAVVTVKEGAVIGPAGGSVSALGGAVSLAFPPGAVAVNTIVTAEVAPGAPASSRLVPETAVELRPSGAAFAVPVRLRLRYDPARVPVGPPERLLGVHRASASAWHSVGASTVDLAGKTVSADLTSFSTYAVLSAAFVASVTLDATDVALDVAGTRQLTATPRDDGNAPLTDREVAWSSSNPSVASVSTGGLVSALSAGSAFITAAIEGKSAMANVVVSAPVATVTVSPAGANIGVGSFQQLDATLRDALGAVLTGRDISWSSSNPSVASVSQSGLVTGQAQGQATITATSEGKSGTSVITVSAPVASVTVTPPASNVNVSDMLVLSATLRDALNNVLTGRPVSWSSGNPAVASVDQSGNVTALSEGVAIITATSEGRSGTAQVNVSAPVVSVTVTPPDANVNVAATQQFTATLRDARNNVLQGRQVLWITSNPAVASVSQTGLVTGLSQGQSTITATSEGRSGTAQVNVSAPVNTVTVTPGSASIAVNGTAQLTATLRDALNNILTGRQVVWSSGNETVATVSQAGLVTGIALGQATITATSEGKSGTAAITVQPPGGMTITSISPATLTPGGTGTITGTNFSTTPADHSLTVAGVAATVTGSTSTTINFTLPSAGFPCQLTQAVTVTLTRTGNSPVNAMHPLASATQRNLALGDALYLTSAADVACNQFPVTGGEYLVSVVNTNSSPTSSAGFALTGSDGTGAFASVSRATPVVRRFAPSSAASGLWSLQAAEQRARDEAHLRMLERNLAVFRSRQSPMVSLTSARIAGGDVQATVVSPVVGTNNTIRVPNLSSGNFCANFLTITARTVYSGTRVIIVEDNTAALAGTMDATFNAMGTHYDAVMHGVLTTNFGNPLALDPSLDNDGKVVMVFSPAVNGFGGIAGFVASCDFFPTSTFPSSNVGEYFYAIVPTHTSNDGTQNGLPFWTVSMRTVVIHEVKHITSFAERISRAGGGSPNFEESWLEEGTARLAEEIWSRSYAGNTWKGNANYASTVFCDLRVFTTCSGKFYTMAVHWTGLYRYYQNQQARSVFGPALGGDFSFYNSVWSLVRFLIDAHAANEGTFMSSILQDHTRKGTANLEHKTGRSFTELLARWSLATWLDDLAGITVNDAGLNVASWNTPSLFAGLNTDIPSSYPVASPLTAFQPGFGNFSVQTSINGGTTTWVWIKGAQSQPQLLRLTGQGGGALPGTIRMAVIRFK